MSQKFIEEAQEMLVNEGKETTRCPNLNKITTIKTSNPKRYTSTYKKKEKQ